MEPRQRLSQWSESCDRHGQMDHATAEATDDVNGIRWIIVVYVNPKHRDSESLRGGNVLTVAEIRHTSCF